jgi:hypothetical protein
MMTSPEQIKTLLESALFALAAGQIQDAEDETREALKALVAFSEIEYECLKDEMEWDDSVDFRDDVEADADTLRSIGWGTDEDYGYFGEEEY